MQEMAVIYPDRVITVQGNVDNMVAAQAAISAKLVECIEKEMQACTNGVSINFCVYSLFRGFIYISNS